MIQCVLRVIDSARNKSTLHRLSFACPSVVSQEDPLLAGIWFVVNGQYAPDGVFIQVESESQIDLLGNARTAISGISLFHSNNGLDDFFGGPFGPGFLPPRGEYRRRYFRFFSALWKWSRVEGLMMIADLSSRRGFRKSDRKPRTVRSCVDRLGARCRDLL